MLDKIWLSIEQKYIKDRKQNQIRNVENLVILFFLIYKNQKINIWSSGGKQATTFQKSFNILMLQ